MLDISDMPWAECSISEKRVIYQTDSLSLKRTVRQMGVMRYEFELVTVDMDMSVGRGVKARISGAIGDTLTFVHPRLSFSQGFEPFSGIQVSGTNSAGDNSADFTATSPWQLKAGDYIQFSNDTKVYEVAEDTLLKSGVQTVKLTNRLRFPLTMSTNVTVNNVAFHLIHNGAIDVSMVASENQDMQITLVAVEKL